jgi:pyrroline-5-carboxylate reductase
MKAATIGFAGLGNMGQAMLAGFLKSGVITPEKIAVLSRSASGAQAARDAGARLCENPEELTAFSDIVILAVKPKDAPGLVSTLSKDLKGKALLSIVAGLGYEAIRERLWGGGTRILVTLPNTPLRIGAGVTGFTLETDFTDEEKTFAESLFSAVGSVEWISEKLLGALSAVSGSGPAYTAIFAEALADGAVRQGLPRDVSRRLAAATIAGSGRLLAETGSLPAAIKDAVASPGGTTIEGVAALENGGFRAAVIEAVRAGAEKFSRLLS